MVGFSDPRVAAIALLSGCRRHKRRVKRVIESIRLCGGRVRSVGRNSKANAGGQWRVEHASHDPFRPVVSRHTPLLVAGERDVMRVQLVVVNSSLRHA
jgi:hypothetical protein